MNICYYEFRTDVTLVICKNNGGMLKQINIENFIYLASTIQLDVWDTVTKLGANEVSFRAHSVSNGGDMGNPQGVIVV